MKYYIVKDKVWDHIISLEYISTKKMLVDPLTKGLPPSVFREHIASVDLREILWFLNKLKGPKVKKPVSKQSCVL
jgi:hypothetical protein